MFQISDYEEIVEESEAVREMTRTTGWKIVEKWLNRRIEASIEDLLSCPIEEVAIKRTQIQSMKGLLLKISEIADLGNY